MIYALIGIPLGLVMFQSIGERLNTFVGLALKHAKRCFKARNPEVNQTNLVMVVSVLSTILMTSMAAVFAKYERWEYFDALYYCFITLTTIGFGDYVALQKESALQSKPEYVILSLIFILFGLSVVSSAVNLLVLKFLTLNTEDERRDEQLRYTANLNPIQLEGDVITSNESAVVAALPMQADHLKQVVPTLDRGKCQLLRNRFNGGGTTTTQGRQQQTDLVPLKTSVGGGPPVSHQLMLDQVRHSWTSQDDNLGSSSQLDHHLDDDDDDDDDYCHHHHYHHQHHLDQGAASGDLAVDENKATCEEDDNYAEDDDESYFEEDSAHPHHHHHHHRRHSQEQLHPHKHHHHLQPHAKPPIHQSKHTNRSSPLNQHHHHHHHHNHRHHKQQPRFQCQPQHTVCNCCSWLSITSAGVSDASATHYPPSLVIGPNGFIKQSQRKQKLRSPAAVVNHDAGMSSIQPQLGATNAEFAINMKPNVIHGGGGINTTTTTTASSTSTDQRQSGSGAKVIRSTKQKAPISSCEYTSSSSLVAMTVNWPSQQSGGRTSGHLPLNSAASQGDLVADGPTNKRTTKGSNRVKPKLVCKSCCQHSECIERALQSRSSDPPSELDSTEKKEGDDS